MKTEEIEITPQHRPIEYVKAGIITGLCSISVLFGLCVLVSAVLIKPGTSFMDIMGIALRIFTFILVGLAVLGLLYGVSRLMSKQIATMQELKRSMLDNRMRSTKVNIAEALPRHIETGMRIASERGLPFKITAAGTLEVSTLYPGLHTLGGIVEADVPKQLPQDILPAPYKFSDMLQGNWQPTNGGILLAAKEEAILVPAGETLCHTTFTGNTDSGKTNNQRLLLLQLLFLQQCVYLADRNYQTYRQDKKTNAVYDYRPIEAQLALEPVTTAKETLALLKYLVGELDDRRIARRKAIVSYPDIYLFIDELPALCAEEPDIMAYVGRIVREARQYGIFFIGAAQDLLNQTLKNDNGAVRENLLTNFYGGGDATTARLVLNIPRGESIDESGLGKQGVTYLRAQGIGLERAKVRTPLCDDQATHLLLGDRLPRDKQTPDIAEPTVDTELQQVVSAGQAGHSSIMKVMAATGLGQNRTRVLLAQAKSKGLIDD